MHRRTFRERTRHFKLDLAQRAQHDMATQLRQHVLKTAPELDRWTDVTLNGRPLAEWATVEIPSSGDLSFVVHQRGFWGRRVDPAQHTKAL